MKNLINCKLNLIQCLMNNVNDILIIIKKNHKFYVEKENVNLFFNII